MPCISFDPETGPRGLQAKLKDLAAEISSELAALDEEQSKALLSDFVSDLFLAAAEQKRREDRHRRQAEGIAAAKAKGVQFGPSRKPLPENFDDCCLAWRNGEMSLSEAADSCGMVKTSFRRAVIRREQEESCTA